jgi:hypothetical protein
MGLQVSPVLPYREKNELRTTGGILGDDALEAPGLVLDLGPEGQEGLEEFLLFVRQGRQKGAENFDGIPGERSHEPGILVVEFP